MREVLFTLAGIAFVLLRTSGHFVLSNCLFLVWLFALVILNWKKIKD